MRALFFVLLAAAAACQPAGGPLSSQPSEQPTDDAPLGAPQDVGVPQSLAELIALTEPEAVEWQDEPQLVQVDVALDESATWTAATAIYLAGDADRLLNLETTAEGIAEERLTLSTLQLQPVPADALADVPPLPEGVLDPAALIEAGGDDLSGCLAAPPETVLYATGAPFAWTGSEWASPPQWSVTVATGDAAVATVDPVTGAVSDCATA